MIDPFKFRKKIIGWIPFIILGCIVGEFLHQVASPENLTKYRLAAIIIGVILFLLSLILRNIAKRNSDNDEDE